MFVCPSTDSARPLSFIAMYAKEGLWLKGGKLPQHDATLMFQLLYILDKKKKKRNYSNQPLIINLVLLLFYMKVQPIR